MARTTEENRVEAGAEALYVHQAHGMGQMAVWSALNNQVKGAYRKWAADVIAAADKVAVEEVDETIKVAEATVEANGKPKH